ncbi:MAG: methyltransferase domain-containing protein [Rhodothermales bacterium]|nr:methyltransferase domain-containing protein [Rhodothermales bacterium]
MGARRKLVQLTRWPPVGLVRFGSLRRTKPISATFGLDRGGALDRHYIQAFLSAHEADIQGHVLEIGTDKYARQYGGDAVSKVDVLHVAENREPVTIIGDLTNADHIPSDTFNCIILTQTLQCVFDLESAIKTVHRILAPGGVVLATIPGISKISRYDMDRWGYFWSFTTASAQRLFEHAFPAANVRVEAYGNVLSAISFLHGLSAGELKKRELDYHDADYQVIITVRAKKPDAST